MDEMTVFNSKCYGVDCRNGTINEEVSATVQAKGGGGYSVNCTHPVLYETFYVESIGHDVRSTQFSKGGSCDTLTANDYKDPMIVCYDARGNGGGGVSNINREPSK